MPKGIILLTFKRKYHQKKVIQCNLRFNVTLYANEGQTHQKAPKVSTET